MCFVYTREVLGESMLSYLTKITLPKLFRVGTVFVPNGFFAEVTFFLTGHSSESSKVLLLSGFWGRGIP